ncbi:amino acid oxidase [Solibacillus isronensis]|uniref:amino acid oxidase n=1 Tax=Solibacillus isronensis TaxID=412383 RepID=UPI00203C4BE3|nr:amino acid oxidase [Solibacillus isronensis]MCM3720974.1 amino acid oxidase [Solibacillus isronensis]
MRLNKILSIISILFLLNLSACSKEEVKYDGEPLKIAVIGHIPELNNKKISFEKISLDELSEDTVQISTNFDAVMITPLMFEEASNDRFVEVYNNSEIPYIFFDSEKRDLPFTKVGYTYETARWEALKNGSHTTIYLSDKDANREDVWYFYLNDEKGLDVLYKEIFEKVKML